MAAVTPITDLIKNAQSYVTTALEHISTFGLSLQGFVAKTTSSYVDADLSNLYNLSDLNTLQLNSVVQQGGELKIDESNDVLGGIDTTVPLDTFKLANFENITVPDMTDTMPSIDLPTTPSTDLTEAVPAPYVPIYPTTEPAIKPYSTPTAVSISPITIPGVALVSMPAYYNPFPSNNLSAPVGSFSFTETDFQTNINTAMNNKVLGDLTNGGYGIESSDEQAIRDRAADMEYANWQLARNSLMSDMAAMGLPMPPGAMAKAMQAADFTASSNLSKLNAETAINRADLFRKNREFAISTAKDITAMERAYHGQKMERALNASRYLVEAGVQMFNSQVSNYNVKVEAFKAKLEEFKTNIAAQQMAIEANKNQIEAAGVTASIQKAQIENYVAQWKAVEMASQIYQTDVSVWKSKIEMEGLKVQNFRAQIDGYVAYVQSKEAEFKMYDAAIRGETAKIDIYKAQADVYATKVKAVEIRANVESKLIDKAIKEFEMQMDKYKADMSMLDVKIKAKIAAGDYKVRAFTANVEKFRATCSAVAEGIRAAVSMNQVSVENMRNRAQSLLQKAELAMKNTQLDSSMKIQAATGGMDGYSRAAAAALSALNTLVAEIQQAPLS